MFFNSFNKFFIPPWQGSDNYVEYKNKENIFLENNGVKGKFVADRCLSNNNHVRREYCVGEPSNNVTYLNEVDFLRQGKYESVFLMGDSHSAMMFESISSAVNDIGYSLFYSGFSDCPTAITRSNNKECNK